jgi:D-glycero-alpha-D-manno-heptose 1-phosphate guanylyltransferase
MIETAVILAGGLGTRLKSVVPDLPKPMAPVNGKPFLASLMNYWAGQGIKRFVLSIGYKSQTIVDYFGNSFGGSAIDYVVETNPLGTGGGLLLANQRLDLDSPYLLLNGDTFFAVNLKRLCFFAENIDADWCFSLFRTSNFERYLSLDIGESNEILSFHSNSTTVTGLANGGVYSLHPRSLSALNLPIGSRISLEDEIFPMLISQKQKVFGMAFDKNFIDIGIPEDYQRAADLIA